MSFDVDDLVRPVATARVMSVGSHATLSEIPHMDVEALLNLRDEIDKYLPATQLSDMNLAEELVLQFQKVKAMQAGVLDSDTSANYKASVVNSCTSALRQLVTMQTELHNAERMKKIEQILILVMQDQPQAVQQDFFDRYERELSTA